MIFSSLCLLSKGNRASIVNICFYSKFAEVFTYRKKVFLPFDFQKEMI